MFSYISTKLIHVGWKPVGATWVDYEKIPNRREVASKITIHTSDAFFYGVFLTEEFGNRKTFGVPICSSSKSSRSN